MKRTIITLVLCMIGVATALSCDNPAAQSSTGNQRVVGTKSGDAIMNINGDPIPAAEILSSTYIRDGLRQYIYFHNLRRIAAEEGVTADPKKIDEHIDLLKQRLIERGDSWEGYLSQMMISEDEYRTSIEESLLQDGIVEKRVGVTEEKMRRVWNDQEDKVVAEYMKENFLPESERPNVTFEMCSEILKLKVLRIDGVPILGDLQAELIDTATLDITCMSDADAEKYEFLILEGAKHKTGKPLEEYQEATGGADTSGDQAAEQTGDAPPAGGVDSAAAGN